MKLSFTPLAKVDALEMIGWRYKPPYDVYNLADTDTVEYLINPENQFYAFKNEQVKLIGYCSFGLDGQVSGGDYRADALDIGMGIHPEFVGIGLGVQFASTVLNFADEKFSATQYRVTIARFNRRAQKVWEKIGFQPIQVFTYEVTGKEFLVYASKAKTS